ncbi:MAG: AraC family transcriptional regulator [Comamonadaceae bacterium]|nr:MAG: AraC family transcriptional regulator [Comamonadaceae bacterium]
MLKPPVTIPMEFVRGMLFGLHRKSLSTTPFLQDAGIDPGLLDETDARVTGEQYVALYRAITIRLRDDGLGFFSRNLKPGTLALIMRSALGAPVLDVAARRIARTLELVQDDVAVIRLNSGELACWGLRFTTVQPNFMHELLLRIFWRILAWFVGGRLTAARFDFAFAEPSYAQGYDQVFPSKRKFGCAHTAVWFDAGMLTAPVRCDEVALRAFFAESQANIILPHRREEELSLKVRQVLQDARYGWPDLPATAAALHMSASTLQRTLLTENTSFQDLKDELRRDVAITRLVATKAPFSDIAADLGFSDSAAFQRAFKRWTGNPPGVYRRDPSVSSRSLQQFAIQSKYCAIAQQTDVS